MSEGLKARADIPHHLEKRLREKFTQQLSWLVQPFYSWDLDGDKLSAEDKATLEGLAQGKLLDAVNSEGFHRKNLVELTRRITSGQIDIRDVIEEDEENDTIQCFNFIRALAIIKLNAAALNASTPEEIEAVRKVTEAYVEKKCIRAEDIANNGNIELQKIISSAESEAKSGGRKGIAWGALESPSEQVTVVPKGGNATEVSPAGPTIGMPTIPPADPTGFSSSLPKADTNRPFSIDDMGAMGKAPTVALKAMAGEIGERATVALTATSESLTNDASRVQIISRPPSPSQRPTPAPLSHGSVNEMLNDPELITGNAVYITDASGSEQKDGRIPLLDRNERPSGQFTIGSSPDCDIHIKFAGVAPVHGELKFENGMMLIRGTVGAFVKVGGGSITREWEEISSGNIIKIVPHKKPNDNGMHSHRLEIPHFRVTMGDVTSREELRKPLKQKALKLQKEFDALRKEKDLGGETAIQLMHMIDAIVHYNEQNQIGAFTPHELEELSTYGSEVARATAKVRQEFSKALAEGQAFQEVFRQLEKVKEENEWDRAAALYQREAALRVKKLHLLPNEHPATVNILHIGPVFSLMNRNDKQKVYYPANIPSKITIGTHPTNTHTMAGSVDPRMNEREKNFMVEAYEDIEDQKPKMRYLGGLVQIQTGEGPMTPPREIIELEPGRSLRIGSYTYIYEEGEHAFSEGAFMDLLEGEKGLIQELLGKIRDQENTTWEQDEEALNNLCYILGLNLPEERKKKLIKQASEELQKIYEKCQIKLLNWENGHDSGYFQTLMLLIEASNQEEFFREPFPINDEQIQRAAQYRLAKYLQEGKTAYEGPAEPIRPQMPAEPLTKGLFSWLGVRGKEQRRYDKEVKIYEKEMEAFQKEQELHRIKQQEQVEALKKAKIGAVEIARFIEFGLINQEELEGRVVEGYKEQIEKVQQIRQLFQKLEDPRINHLDIFKTLNEMCEGMKASDIFAPEEITTRSLHCQVDLKKFPHLTGERGYIHQLAQIHGGKALERLDIRRGMTETAKDLDLINGLLEAKIIHAVQLNTSIEEFKDLDQIMEKLEEKEKEVDSQRSIAERKRSKELHAQLIAEDEEKRRDEYLERSKEISRSKEQAEQIDMSDPEQVEGALTSMVINAPYALNPGMAQWMTDVNIVVPERVEIVEIEGDGPNIQLQAKELVKSWKEYQREWKKVFIGLAQRCAQNVCVAAGLRASSGNKLIEDSIRSGFFSFSDLSTPSRPIKPEDLTRGMQTEQFIREHLRKDCTDFSYLEFQSKEEKDQELLEDIKAQITQIKLEFMVEEWKAGHKKSLYKRKIKKLQREDPRAIEMIKALDLDQESRDLLQIENKL